MVAPDTALPCEVSFQSPTVSSKPRRGAQERSRLQWAGSWIGFQVLALVSEQASGLHLAPG